MLGCGPSLLSSTLGEEACVKTYAAAAQPQAPPRLQVTVDMQTITETMEPDHTWDVPPCWE